MGGNLLCVTDELARRLEYAEAVDAASCVEATCGLNPESGAVTRAAAGGVLTFCGPESPVTHAIGVGMHGPVTLEEVAEIERFFLSRGAPVSIDVSPHADPSLREMLSARGYRITDFQNVMVRALPGDPLPEPAAGLMVREAAPEDEEIWIRTILRGYFGRDEVTSEELDLGRSLFHMPCAKAYLAHLEGADEPVAGGGMSIRNGVASLFGDGALRAWRRRGAHTALIRARVEEAVRAGCDVATAGTLPGGASCRNYQRLGFQIAYSKITMTLLPPAD